MNQKKDQRKRMRTSIKKIQSTRGQAHKKLEPPLWNLIPVTVLLAIYTYFGDVDRVSMARVCKTWHRVFHVSALWRSRQIDFGGRRSKREIKEKALFKSKTASLISYGKYAIGFSKQFAVCLQEIKINVFLTSGVKDIVNVFKEFSACLDGAKLRSIDISYFELDMVSPQKRIDLIDSLKRLIHNQHCLQKFRLESKRLDFDIGLQVIHCLANASAATLQDLFLNDLFKSETSIYREGRVFTDLQKFSGLSCIEMAYDVMSEELAKAWVTGCPNLSFIKLRAKHYVHPDHVVSCETWKSLVNTHPKLLVKLRVFELQDTTRTLDMLSPAIPLFNLVWFQYREVTTEFELTRILHRVANYHRTLKHLYLRLVGEFSNLDNTTVQKKLTKCTHLLPFQCMNFPRISMWKLAQKAWSFEGIGI